MSTNITSFTYPAIRTALTQCAGEVEVMRKAFAGTGGGHEQPAEQDSRHAVCQGDGRVYAFPKVSGSFGKVTPRDAGLTVLCPSARPSWRKPWSPLCPGRTSAAAARSTSAFPSRAARTRSTAGLGQAREVSLHVEVAHASHTLVHGPHPRRIPRPPAGRTVPQGAVHAVCVGAGYPRPGSSASSLRL